MRRFRKKNLQKSRKEFRKSRVICDIKTINKRKSKENPRTHDVGGWWINLANYLCHSRLRVTKTLSYLD